MLLTGAFIASFLAIIAAENCEQIDGVRQSPVNIDTSSLLPGFAEPLKWSSGYFEVQHELALVNNGETLRLSANHSTPIQLSGGRLDVAYDFQQLHFHWGDSDEKGSEHKISGKTYPLEMHVVHTQSSTNNSDQYVVLGFFFRISQRDNEGLHNLLETAIAAAENRNHLIHVEPFALSQLVPTGPFSYYTYKGSLTTEPYTESVTWIISSTALPISRSQLDTFRKAAQIDRGLNDNFRCIQDLNDRVIRYIIPVY